MGLRGFILALKPNSPVYRVASSVTTSFEHPGTCSVYSFVIVYDLRVVSPAVVWVLVSSVVESSKPTVTSSDVVSVFSFSIPVEASTEPLMKGVNEASTPTDNSANMVFVISDIWWLVWLPDTVLEVDSTDPSMSLKVDVETTVSEKIFFAVAECRIPVRSMVHLSARAASTPENEAVDASS